MTSSTPPWKRRSRNKKVRGTAQGPSEAVRDDERGSFPGAPGVPGAPGEEASLESADDHESTGDLPAPVAGGDGARRGGAVARGARTARTGLAKGGAAAKASIGYLADRIIENAPRVPVRDLATLRKQFPGLDPEQLADKLVTGAAAATSTVGAGVGAAAMLPVPPAMPTELAAEVTGVAAIELKLIAELHEVYGLRPPGALKARSSAYLTAWTEERGIDVAKPTTVNAALGVHMKRELRQQIMKRMVRNLPSLAPFMIGAAVGAVMNRRDTRKLADRVRQDLRRHQVPWESLNELPPLEEPPDALEIGA
ncbi:hypothetical protein [Streptomyces endophyticus]|uniref:EcsC family protein n=1 Tax=Streptomyces endophyticus TaxID=714166 RepID=A0ABU6FGQ2_9ACTN|nr:hypothetical protein [Streptomyces endophyticus]MEB8343128.1 EcsC family protein [Streptomyces endophyticus]